MNIIDELTGISQKVVHYLMSNDIDGYLKMCDEYIQEKSNDDYRRLNVMKTLVVATRIPNMWNLTNQDWPDERVKEKIKEINVAFEEAELRFLKKRKNE